MHLKHREYSSYSVIALSCLFSINLMVQIKPVLPPAWFSLGIEFSPDEHLRRIPPLPYHTPLIFTPATLAILDLWTIYFPQNNEALLD